jgi:hypothetical protein
MYFPSSFTKDLAKALGAFFNKTGTDALVGISAYDYKRVLTKLNAFIEDTQVNWEDPIEIDQIESKKILDKEVTYCYLTCADQDDVWELIIVESDVGTVISVIRI